MVKHTHLIAAIISVIIISSPATAQEPIRDSLHAATVPVGIDGPRLATVCGITAAGLIGGYLFQSNLWWKGEQSAFHFDWEHDWTYALGADKAGHFFFPYLATSIYGDAFSWCGIDTATSLWLGGGLALTHQTYVEIKDGFSKEWGFSWGDFGANTLGAAYPLAQYYLPSLRNFDFKISFNPSEKFKAGGYGAIIDDYESTYHWLSVDVHNLLPQSMRDYYPPWMNIALGHSVKDLDLKGAGTHELYISLDWNLEALPGNGWFWNLLKKNLNYYRLPAPAVRIYPDVVWYGIKI